MRRTTLLLLSVALAVAPSAGADGMLDPAFGNGGLVMTAFPGQFSNDTAMSLVMLPDGRAVAAGSTNVNLAFTAMAVARYLTTGALDTTFDGDGLVTVPFIPPGPGIDAFSEARRCCCSRTDGWCWSATPRDRSRIRASSRSRG
jgi:hypothetical protein